jgi:hypothetical protein
MARFAMTAEEQIRHARANVRNANDPAFRRVEIDTLLQAELGRFFAEELRAGIAYTLYQKRSDEGDALRNAIVH